MSHAPAPVLTRWPAAFRRGSLSRLSGPDDARPKRRHSFRPTNKNGRVAVGYRLSCPAAAGNKNCRFDSGQSQLVARNSSRGASMEQRGSSMKFHPLADLFPMMADAEIGELAADIKAHGLQESISTYEGMILDGRNRFVGCEQAGVKPKFSAWTPLNGETPLDFVLAKNLHRRHLTTSQRAMVATRLSALSQGEKRADSPIGLSQTDAAEALNVGLNAVKQARKVTEHAAPEVAAAVTAGTVSVSDAAAVADAPKAEQRKALKAVESGKAKTLKQQIKKPVLCSRCRRVGVVKDCEACALMRKVKSGKATLSEQTAALPDEEPADETIEDQIKAKNAELEGWCRDLMQFAETMPDDPWLQDLNRRKGALEKLKNCCETIRSAKCHCRCPKCDGAGCRQCHKTGRMTKYAVDQL